MLGTTWLQSRIETPPRMSCLEACFLLSLAQEAFTGICLFFSDPLQAYELILQGHLSFPSESLCLPSFGNPGIGPLVRNSLHVRKQ